METEKKSNSKLSWLIILLLIIIIIILLFFLRIGRTNEKYLVPTGNVDVFNIDTVCKCKKCKDVNGDQTDIEPPYDIPTYNEKTDKDVIGELFVDDKNGNFLFQQNLRIFENAAYKFENKIAPGVSNTYQFVIHNSSNVNVKYDILMYEESEYQINMKYRLKKNDKYIIGNDDKWVSATELKTAFANLNIGASDNYSLDWKWFDDDENDNIAGKNMTSEYKLNIRITYEEI